MYHVDAITFATRCAWHGAQQIAAPVACLVAPDVVATYQDGSMGEYGAARYGIAGVVYQLQRNGALVQVQQGRKAA